MGLVSCNLIGRMGNQMFQISATIAYALRHGLEYHIPAHTLNDSIWKPMFTHLENPNWNPESKQVIMTELVHDYIPLPIPHESMNGNTNTIVHGYRQSIKYFEDYLPEVRFAFGFDYRVYTSNTCAIHIRRGDYLQLAEHHPLVSESYLLKAMNDMATKCENFLFFSDDIEWCRSFVGKYVNLLYGEQIPNISFSFNNDEISDFQSMLSCGSFIISNSTFSLMAAILSESENKIVISPSKQNWFGIKNRHLSTEDIIPDSFIQIKY